jgi:ABC-2 type transport system permease protein
MRNTIAIARRELGAYFTTPLAWIVFTLMGFLAAFFFIGGLGKFQEVQEYAKAVTWQRLGPDAAPFKNLTDGVIIPLWGSVLVITLFVAPFLSMRLFAEEKKQKTFELLMTTPVRPVEIVLGKFFAAVAIVGATVGMTIIFPLMLSVVGSSESGTALEWSTVGLGYLAIMLLGITIMAVGMFISSLTDSQMIAAFFTFVVSLAWFMLSYAIGKVDEPVKSIVTYVSLDHQMQNLMRGSFDPKALVFFGTVIVLQLVLTHRSIEAQRWT